jgi:hypothetical protein
VSYRCPACGRRVRRAPYVSLQDRHTRKVTRYHGGAATCLEAATLEAEQRGADEIVLAFVHRKGCDPADKMSCRGGCFVVSYAQLVEKGAA